MKSIAIGLGAVVALAILMLVIRRIRGGRIDWDDEDEDDFYDDDDDEDDWSPFGSGASALPTTSFGDQKSSRSPPSLSLIHISEPTRPY